MISRQRAYGAIILALSLTLAACSSPQKDTAKEGGELNHLIGSTLWMQRAAEVRALSYQAYNIAKLRLDEDIKKFPNAKKPRAIVVDVDETLVDNSPFQARSVINKEAYPTGWKEWVEEARARAVPGALDFIQYANSKGADIFYVTNRKIRGFDPTYKNLVELGFPVKKEHMLLRTSTSSKKERREKILETHRIVLLIGDNLNDFTHLFEKKPTDFRHQVADQLKDEWGKRFVVLPNPMYGDWEGAIYQYDWKKTLPQRRQTQMSNLLVK